jgi:hypothetical protein
VAHKAAVSAVAYQLHVVHSMAGVCWVSWRYVLAVTHFRRTHNETELGVGELRVDCYWWTS